MTTEIKKHLFDIQKACLQITQFAAGQTGVEYENSALLRSAIERQFLIVGEALSRLYHADPLTCERITDYRRIISFRNIVVHGYDVINNQRVWEIVSDGVPVLLREVEQLLLE